LVGEKGRPKNLLEAVGEEDRFQVVVVVAEDHLLGEEEEGAG
jgi:hypothetical protein